MKTSSVICSGALIAFISLPGWGQNPESRDKDKTRTTKLTARRRTPLTRVTPRSVLGIISLWI